MKVALTGGIACGKSLLSNFLRELGVETIDADDVVHELIPDPAERRRIAAEVFADPEKRRALEAKIHPVVKERIDRWFEGLGVRGRNRPLRVGATLGEATEPSGASAEESGVRSRARVKIAIIPLLFEAHWEKNFDIICCVVSSREKQIERMMTTRGMTLAEAEARLAAQMPVEEKARRSQYVIRNDGTAEELRAEAQKLVDTLCASASLR